MSLNYKGQSLFIDNTSVKSIAKKILPPFMFILTKKLKIILKLFIIILKK